MSDLSKFLRGRGVPEEAISLMEEEKLSTDNEIPQDSEYEDLHPARRPIPPPPPPSPQ